MYLAQAQRSPHPPHILLHPLRSLGTRRRLPERSLEIHRNLYRPQFHQLHTHLRQRTDLHLHFFTASDHSQRECGEKAVYQDCKSVRRHNITPHYRFSKRAIQGGREICSRTRSLGAEERLGEQSSEALLRWYDEIERRVTWRLGGSAGGRWTRLFLGVIGAVLQSPIVSNQEIWLNFERNIFSSYQYYVLLRYALRKRGMRKGSLHAAEQKTRRESDCPMDCTRAMCRPPQKTTLTTSMLHHSRSNR